MKEEKRSRELLELQKQMTAELLDWSRCAVTGQLGRENHGSVGV
jgi:hypothetical protein